MLVNAKNFQFDLKKRRNSDTNMLTFYLQWNHDFQTPFWGKLIRANYQEVRKIGDEIGHFRGGISSNLTW